MNYLTFVPNASDILINVRFQDNSTLLFKVTNPSPAFRAKIDRISAIDDITAQWSAFFLKFGTMYAQWRPSHFSILSEP